MSNDLWQYLPESLKGCLVVGLFFSVWAAHGVTAYFFPEVWYLGMIALVVVMRVYAAKVLRGIEEREQWILGGEADEHADRRGVASLIRVCKQAQVTFICVASLLAFYAYGTDIRATKWLARRYLVPKYAHEVTRLSSDGDLYKVIELKDSVHWGWHLLYEFHIIVYLLIVLVVAHGIYARFKGAETRLQGYIGRQDDPLF